MTKTLELVIEALLEDARADTGSAFTAMAFEAFFPEQDPSDVVAAWPEYRAIRSGHYTVENLIEREAKVS